MLASKSIPLIAFSFLLTNHALALNLQSYRFTDSYRYSMLDDGLKEKFPGKYVATASYGYVHSPFYRSDTYLHDLKREIIKSNHVLTTGFTYYLADNASLGLDISGVHNEVFRESYTTFGDTNLRGKYSFLRTETSSLSLNPQVIIPTGSGDNFSTTGSIGGALSVVGEKSFNRLHLLASVGGMSAKNNVYREVDHRQLLLTQLGLSYDVTEKLNINLEAYRNFPLVNDVYQDEGKYFVTGKHKTHERLSTYFGFGASGVDDLQRNTYSAFAGLKFHEAMPVAQPISVTSAAPVRMRRPTEEIYFGHDKFQLKKSEEEKLQSYIEYFQKNQGMIHTVEIEGHASKPGPAAYNMKLSQKRADTVKQVLIKNGIREDLLTTRAFGESGPQVKDDSLNRKVKFSIKKIEVAHEN